MREYAEMGYLDVWYSRIDEQGVLAALSPEARMIAEQIMAKARQRGHMQVLGKMAELVDDRQRIVEQTPFIVRETHTPDGRPIAEALAAFAIRRLPPGGAPAAVRAVPGRGRGQEGRGRRERRHPLLGHPVTGNGPDDPLFLQYKEAQPSVLAPYSKAPAWDCEGQRVVVGSG